MKLYFSVEKNIWNFSENRGFCKNFEESVVVAVVYCKQYKRAG